MQGQNRDLNLNKHGVSGCVFQLHCINLYQSICQMLDCFPWENCHHETPGKVILKPHKGYKRNKEPVANVHIYQPSRVWISGQLIFIPWLLQDSGSWATTHSCTVSVLGGEKRKLATSPSPGPRPTHILLTRRNGLFRPENCKKHHGQPEHVCLEK